MKWMILRTIIFGALCLLYTDASAQVPHVISYQGRVVVGSTNFDGTGSFKFALMNNANGHTLWSNDGTSVNGSEPTKAVSLSVANGLYSVLLGDGAVTNMTPIPSTVFNNSDVRLRVWFNDGTHGSQLISPDQRIASVGYAMIAETVADGSISSAKLAPGSVGPTQLAAGVAATNLSSTLADPSNAFVVGGPSLFPDLDQTPWIGGGAKLTIQGTESDKPSFAVIGDYRNGSSGDRYATAIYPNGGLVTNAYISIAGMDGQADSASMLAIQADVPVAMSLYSPYNAFSGGTLISGWGIPAGSSYSRVFEVNSQGTMRLVNPYGNGYTLPQMILRATDAGNPNHNDFAIRTIDGDTLLGTWNDSQAAFKNSPPWTGLAEIRVRPGQVDIIANAFKTYGGIQVGDGLNDPGANNIAVAGLTADRVVYADSNNKLTSAAYRPTDVVRKDEAPKISVYNAAGQSISDSSITKMTWDFEVFDTNASFGGNKFTPIVPGKYLLTAGVTFLNVNQGAQVKVLIYKNGAQYAVLGAVYPGASGANPLVGGSVMVDANGSTDYFEVFVFQNSGGSLSTFAGSANTYFQGALLP
jgi:hypothetical protein